MTPITGLGVGGPQRAYAVFADKSETDLPAERITGLGVGGPGVYYGVFADKGTSDPSLLVTFNYPIYCRTRKRR